jgi:hypothetical protein
MPSFEGQKEEEVSGVSNHPFTVKKRRNNTCAGTTFSLTKVQSIKFASTTVPSLRMTAKDLLATNQYSKISAIEHRYTQNLDRFVSDEMSGSITCSHWQDDNERYQRDNNVMKEQRQW